MSSWNPFRAPPEPEEPEGPRMVIGATGALIGWESEVEAERERGKRQEESLRAQAESRRADQAAALAEYGAHDRAREQALLSELPPEFRPPGA